MITETIDILFVLNQDVDFRIVEKIAEKNRPHNILLLTTHYLLKHEREQLRSRLTANHVIFSFSQFLSDEEMEECDNLASNMLLKRSQGDYKVRTNYFSYFKDHSLYNKNKKVCEKLTAQFSISKIFFATGLGIHSGFWAKMGGKALPKQRGSRRIKQAVITLRDLARTPITTITYDDYFFVFFEDVSNLCLPKEAKVKQVDLLPILKCISIVPSQNSGSLLKRRIVDLLKSNNKKCVVDPTDSEIQNYIFTVHKITTILHDKKLFVFPSPVRRLGFSNDVRITENEYLPCKFLSSSRLENNKFKFLERFVQSILPVGVVPIIATTIHDYSSDYESYSLPVQIFVDGFHPANYPRSYIDSYINGSFVVRDMFDSKWFAKYGREVIKSYPFMEKNYLESPEEKVEINAVYLMLNHAGDWTALINRSDSDILVECFVEIAKYFPNLNFVIRLHPTMIHEEHEGKKSSERIREYVRWCDLDNLTISEDSLEHDLATGDIFVSEYSAALLDAYSSGKLGIIVNLTNRRSFMEDYEKIGFQYVNSRNELESIIENILSDSGEHLQRQNTAVSRYNELLQDFYEKA
jgi:hypothetical protein